MKEFDFKRFMLTQELLGNFGYYPRHNLMRLLGHTYVPMTISVVRKPNE